MLGIGLYQMTATQAATNWSLPSLVNAFCSSGNNGSPDPNPELENGRIASVLRNAGLLSNTQRVFIVKAIRRPYGPVEDQVRWEIVVGDDASSRMTALELIPCTGSVRLVQQF